MNPVFKKTTIDNIEKWKELTIDSIREQMKTKRAYLATVFMYFESTRTIAILPAFMFMQDNRGKDALSAMIRAIAAKEKPDAIIFASETWMIFGEEEEKEKLNKEYIKYSSLEDHPDRKEILFISYEDKHKEETHSSYIRRDKKGRFVRLDKWDTPGNIGIKGRFGEFIKGKPEFSNN